eukprot:TRINITY_DN307_c0_g1::TRINITY_DN307_c0_g1_i1::g.7454::m.7454 TRINITY_DN307_c0_g1::TRINITY_DN307_c0_g1_i1::g.7454  ORF type:complete len:488 (+),score=104.53,sp/Q0P4R6/RBM46_XENTR/35.32/2e-36,RRM_1/PF00076.17/4.8e-12,RRM_1/PF00076.17/4.8e-11,RRM_1/PF00076.17/4.9e-09,RRM_6/PF14259.1/2.7e-10,RRM_6/PF14259.1/1.2e-06,RRM_6/PF14259.1/1.7e-07,RRM_5/PF13893.1/0.00017,RRM_5/PF13893.1/0.52,RRM_5/PF13893.1/0.0011,Nup35_RRM_2/PF14605.1/20,Nup35_RRM_2/PF14605.1/0.0051,RRM_3/PF08777.6/34,RRM_3/PF08777.6/2e+03,
MSEEAVETVVSQEPDQTMEANNDDETPAEFHDAPQESNETDGADGTDGAEQQPETSSKSVQGGCEVFFGNIPKGFNDDDLRKIADTVGTIRQVTIKRNKATGEGLGFGFVIYNDAETARNAIATLDNKDISQEKPLSVKQSTANRKLFIGNIPKDTTKEELEKSIREHFEHVCGFEIFPLLNEPSKHRGFGFIQFETGLDAGRALKKFFRDPLRIKSATCTVTWAEQEDEPDAEAMSKVKTVYLRGFSAETTDEEIRAFVEPYGEIESFKRPPSQHYAYVAYVERACTEKAIAALNASEIKPGMKIEATLAKPQSSRSRGGFRGGFGGPMRGRGGFGGPQGGYGGGGYGGQRYQPYGSPQRGRGGRGGYGGDRGGYGGDRGPRGGYGGGNDFRGRGRGGMGPSRGGRGGYGGFADYTPPPYPQQNSYSTPYDYQPPQNQYYGQQQYGAPAGGYQQSYDTGYQQQGYQQQPDYQAGGYGGYPAGTYSQ